MSDTEELDYTPKGLIEEPDIEDVWEEKWDYDEDNA